MTYGTSEWNTLNSIGPCINIMEMKQFDSNSTIHLKPTYNLVLWLYIKQWNNQFCIIYVITEWS